MDDLLREPHPLAVWSVRLLRLVVCLILIGVIVGAVYATCLPSLFYQRQAAEHVGNHRGPRR